MTRTLVRRRSSEVVALLLTAVVLVSCGNSSSSQTGTGGAGHGNRRQGDRAGGLSGVGNWRHVGPHRQRRDDDSHRERRLERDPAAARAAWERWAA